MAISPIGNITYINQNTAANLAHTRVDITPSNLREFEHKINEMQETRATENLEALHKDSQGNGGSMQQQQQSQQQEEHEDATSLHLLDIKA